MKTKLLATLSMLTTALISSSANAALLTQNNGLVPYVGADAQLRYMQFKKDYGQQDFKKDHYKQGNVFVGLKFNQYVGVEFGLFKSLVVKNVNSIPLDFSLGLPVDPSQPAQLVIANNKVVLRGFNINIVGFWPLDDCNQLIGAVGVNQTRIQLVHQQIADGFGIFPPETMVAQRFTFSSRKSTVQVKAGFQRYLTEKLSFRAMIGWENTNRFKGLTPIEPHQNSPIRAFLKYSYTFGLGIVFDL